MTDLNCEYLVREGVCGGNLDVCCVHQRVPGMNDCGVKIRSILECICVYPEENERKDYTDAIRGLASALAKEGM